MIKVNLNQTKTAYGESTYSTGMAQEETSTFIKTALTEIQKFGVEGVSAEIIFKIVINVILILFFPLGLKIYEINQINKLKNIETQQNNILKSKTNEIAKLNAELKKSEALKEASKEFKNKLDFLKKLADSRIVIPLTIDLIQSKIPENVWLDNLDMKLLSDNQSTEVKLNGMSFNEVYVNDFARSLNNVLDGNSIKVRTSDTKSRDGVIKVKFNLEGIKG